LLYVINMSTQDQEFIPTIPNGKEVDLIKDLHAFTGDIRQRIVFVLQHFTSSKYCPICEEPIRMSVNDNVDDYDIHMNNIHSDEEVINRFRLFLKQFKL